MHYIYPMQQTTHNPWQITGETEKYNNPWISVTEYQVLNPAGNPGIYGKVSFKNLAIGVLPLDADWNTYLVGQFRFPLNAYSWEMPEGGGAMDVEPLESAKRELLEETGLKAHKWTEILRMHLSNSVSDELAIIYVAQDLEQFEPEPEETEQLVIRKLPFTEVYNMVSKGEITDSMTVGAVLKAKLMLLENQL